MATPTAAHEINPLIGADSQDTLMNARAALAFLGDTLENLATERNCDTLYGMALLVKTIRAAIGHANENFGKNTTDDKRTEQPGHGQQTN